MENRVPRLPGGRKKAIPLILRIVMVTVICAGISIFALYFLLHDRGHRLFQSANTVSEYLTAQEFSVSADDANASHAVSTNAATEEPTVSPTNDRISISQYATLQLGDNNAAVAELQQRFMELGYMEGDEPDTLYNESTQNAVILFQRATNTPMTGIATAELQQMLFSENAQEYRIKLNDDGADVKGIQRRLSYLGYYVDRITGYFGPQTEQAVILFQSKNGIGVNGQISRSDWDLLYSDEVVELATPTPSPTPTPTPKPTPTPSPKPTPTPRTTPTPKETATPRTTNTPKVSATAAVSQTPARTEAPINTDSPAITETPLSTSEVTASPEVTVQPTETPTETPTHAPTDAPETPTPRPTPKPGSDGSYGHSVSEFIRCAEAHLGDPYILGDEGPGSFDCSGLVYYCLKKCGVSVSRLNAYSFSNKDSWQRIDSVDDLKKGDLLFFKSDTSSKVNHAAIYLGGGRFIHASASKGEVVYSSFGPYWYRNFVCGRRVF